jgi:hypothetical protein
MQNYRVTKGVCPRYSHVFIISCVQPNVVDPHHVDADPDPTFHFDADPDLTCHFDAGQDAEPDFLYDAFPDAGPYPYFYLMQIRIRVVYLMRIPIPIQVPKMMRIRIHNTVPAKPVLYCLYHTAYFAVPLLLFCRPSCNILNNVPTFGRPAFLKYQLRNLGEN